MTEADREAVGAHERRRHLENATRSDHPFRAPTHEPWGRCLDCGLSESAHVDTTVPYHPRPRRPEP